MHVFALALAVLACATTAAAQGGRTFRVGWLSHGEPSADSQVRDFVAGLRQQGYIDGRNVLIDYRFAGGKIADLPKLGADLVASGVDVIVTAGEPAAFAAKHATTSIPVVVTEFGQDPVAAGLVANLARPEGNVTGLATMSDELWQKRVGLMTELIPKLARIAVVWNPTNPGNAHCISEIRRAAEAIGAKVLALEVVDEASTRRTLAGVASESIDVLTMCADSVTLKNAAAVAAYAVARRVPAFGPAREYVEAGAMISYGASVAAQRRRAAHYVDRLLKGARPADLPIERATNFDLVLNLGTARAMGRAIPPMLVLIADDALQ